MYEKTDLSQQNLLGVFLPFPKRCRSPDPRKSLPSWAFSKEVSPNASLCVWIPSFPVSGFGVFFCSLYPFDLLATGRKKASA